MKGSRLAGLALIALAPLGILAPVDSADAAHAVEAVDTGARFVPYSGMQWIQDLVSVVGDLPERVVFDITDSGNCGSMLSPGGTGGACTHKEHGHTTIDISPSAVFTAYGVHLVYHELGHAFGAGSECKAEAFAHKYSDANVWSYPSCRQGIEP